jgi:hypothetical protein
MRLKPFLLDAWLDTYEHGIEFNILPLAPAPPGLPTNSSTWAAKSLASVT